MYDIPEVVGGHFGIVRAAEFCIRVSLITTEGDHDLLSCLLTSADLISETLAGSSSLGAIKESPA